MARLERSGACTPVRNPVVQEWIERAEHHWRMAEQLPDLPPGDLSGLFQVQRCLETDLRAALIAQQIPSRQCRDLVVLVCDAVCSNVGKTGWLCQPPDQHTGYQEGSRCRSRNQKLLSQGSVEIGMGAHLAEQAARLPGGCCHPRRGVIKRCQHSTHLAPLVSGQAAGVATMG